VGRNNDDNLRKRISWRMAKSSETKVIFKSEIYIKKNIEVKRERSPKTVSV
jgi:hypothetical protein